MNPSGRFDKNVFDMGRRTKLTKEIQGALVEGVGLGLKIEDTCALAGIGQSTYFSWLDKGEKGKVEIYVEFLEAIKKAQSQRKKVLLWRIYQAACGGKIIKDKKTTTRLVHGTKTTVIEVVEIEHEVAPDWKADAWMLERGFPDEFGRRYQVDVSDWRKQAEKAGIDPGEIDYAFNKLVDEIAARGARGCGEK